MASRGKLFVPVTDVEKSRAEQDFYDENQRKHRKFDTLNTNQNVSSTKTKKKVDRGWGGAGAV
eukprot:CAMPEP_0194589256 /NCGR_PEP_ID=MMETSP0292-20121207/20489_1 /TAXON_ID=39354 /ORGANISM="Heterosigma akashiwo, Strain CCMP2393" /LENGTH=62 /DNA_ID=CAMNT_0039446359 /DNA_START=46 /DNA_END=231 /DNA_ORIENTATION=+